MDSRSFVLAILVLPLVPLVAADAHGDCDAKGNVALGVVTIREFYVIGPPVAYFDDRNYAQGNGMWIYVESNSVDGLQRGGSSAYVPGDSEICYDDSPAGPDTLIF